MTKNMGSADKTIRLAIAAVIAVLFFMNVIPGTLGIVLLVVAIIFAATSFVSFCPIYAVLGIKTCPVEKKD